MNTIVNSRRSACAALLFVLPFYAEAGAAHLSLAEAERLALTDEPGVLALRADAAAQRERAVADAQLPDPELTATAFNFPVDTFDFDQEPITQLRFGFRQRMPDRTERSARRSIAESRATTSDARGRGRVRDVLRGVRLALIELAWRQAEQSRLEAAETLFEELESSALAGYRQGSGAQQDVLRARLEMSVLEDRLRGVRAARESAGAELARWIGAPALAAHVALESPEPLAGDDTALLDGHPALRQLDAEREVARGGIELARSDYRPDWAFEIVYGARDDASPFGNRPDFLTAGVSVQLPLFAAQRQDRRLAASQQEAEAARVRRIDGLRELKRALDVQRVRASETDDRIDLHERQLLPQAAETVKAARAELASGVVDYAEVVRAALVEIELAITLERLRADRARIDTELAWLLGDDVARAQEETL